MGFLDSLLGTKTNDATTQATQQVASNNLSTVLNNAGILNNQYNTATNAVNTGAANALGSINNLYGQATDAVKGYGAQALDYLTQGSQNAAATAQSSNGRYTPYVANGQNASNMLSNATGLNGAAGNTAATGAFQASPGYQYQVDQATDAAARKAASLGIAGSGNTLAGITTLGSNLANQEYQQWLTNLSGIGTQGLSAANAVSGNNNTAAGLMNTAATSGASLLNNQGSTLGTILANQGNQSATINNGLGTNLASLSTNLGTSLAANNWTGTNSTNSATLANGTSQDAADNSSSGVLGQILGAGLGLAGKTATGTAVKNKLLSL